MKVSQDQRPLTDEGRTAGDPKPETADGATGAILNAAQLRWVKISIIVMTAMFAVGIPLLIGRIIYLARSGGTPAPVAASLPAALVDAARVPLPEGATVRGVSLAGSRLAVHFVTVSGTEEVHVLDLQSGQVINRTEFVRPRGRF